MTGRLSVSVAMAPAAVLVGCGAHSSPLGADGRRPRLTRFRSDRYIAGSTPANAASWIEHPQRYEPRYDHARPRRALAGGQRHRRPSGGALVRRALLILVLAVPLGWSAAAAAAQPPIVVPESSGSTPELELGRELFGGNCARCHGSRGEGIRTPTGDTQSTGAGPSLEGVSPSTIDFYLRTGYMPLANPGDQPERRGPQFEPRQLRALERYVDSISDGTTPVPAPDPDRGSVSEGLELFTEHCAGCHQVVAEGGVVTGARVPPLAGVPPVEIAEAVRTGPFVMPRFSEKDISDSELESIIAYVRYAQDPDDRGGWGINHLGPFPEGMVTWLLAAIVLVATCILIGERLRS